MKNILNILKYILIKFLFKILNKNKHLKIFKRYGNKTSFNNLFTSFREKEKKEKKERKEK